jgi:hypothetical protein
VIGWDGWDGWGWWDEGIGEYVRNMNIMLKKMISRTEMALTA